MERRKVQVLLILSSEPGSPDVWCTEPSSDLLSSVGTGRLSPCWRFWTSAACLHTVTQPERKGSWLVPQEWTPPSIKKNKIELECSVNLWFSCFQLQIVSRALKSFWKKVLTSQYGEVFRMLKIFLLTKTKVSSKFQDLDLSRMQTYQRWSPWCSFLPSSHQDSVLLPVYNWKLREANACG